MCGDYMELGLNKNLLDLIKLMNLSQMQKFAFNVCDSKTEIIMMKNNKYPKNFLRVAIKNNYKIHIIVFDSERYIVSPVVGFYRLTGGKYNVNCRKIGEKIHKGDIVCVIEILNIDYELKSDFDGYVSEIFLSDACLVDYNQRILKMYSVNYDKLFYRNA